MVLIFGYLALDTTRTPFKTVERIMGGPAPYASLAASFFTDVDLVGIAGEDFPKEYIELLRRRMDISGLEIKPGKTFFFDSAFDYDMGKRTVYKTEVNVIADYEPVVPEGLRRSRFVYLSTTEPNQGISVINQLKNPRFVACDTIKYWIDNTYADMVNLFSMVDCVIINDDEARMIVKNANLITCAKKVMDFGPSYVIIKKGEHGALLFKENGDYCYPSPAFPMEGVVDPTGAGDSFGGGFIGHIERRGDLSERTLKEATVYGNVMGSFAVEDFGINKFLTINCEDITSRFEKFRNLVHF